MQGFKAYEDGRQGNVPEGLRMDERLISVIVPVYQVEPYLSKCIRSILRQSYSYLDILLIDDGSTDGSAHICDCFAKKDRRVRVFHKPNEGVAVTRNKGIQWAKGEYICFVDGDDWLPAKSIETLYRALDRHRAQFSVGTIEAISPSYCFMLKCYDDVVKRSDEERMVPHVFEPNCSTGYMVAKLFNRRVIVEHHIEFVESMKCYEDSYFTHRYMDCCDTLAFCHDTVYYYNRFNQNAATRRYYDEQLKWYCMQLETRLRLCSGIYRAGDVNHATYQHILSCIAEHFAQIVMLYFNSALDEKAKKEKIAEASERFREYVPAEQIGALDRIGGKYGAVLKWALENDSERVYDWLSAEQKKNGTARSTWVDKLSGIPRRLKGLLRYMCYRMG